MVVCHEGDLDGAVCFDQGFGPQVQQPVFEPLWSYQATQTWHKRRNLFEED